MSFFNGANAIGFTRRELDELNGAFDRLMAHARAARLPRHLRAEYEAAVASAVMECFQPGLDARLIAQAAAIALRPPGTTVH